MIQMMYHSLIIQSPIKFALDVKINRKNNDSSAMKQTNAWDI